MKMDKSCKTETNKILDKKLERILELRGEIPVYATKHFVEQSFERFNFSDFDQLERVVSDCFSEGKLCKIRTLSGNYLLRNVLAANYGKLTIVFDTEDRRRKPSISLITSYKQDTDVLKGKRNSPLDGAYIGNSQDVLTWIEGIGKKL